MTEFLTLITSFPTVVYTILVGLSLVYWLFVIVGAADLDMLDALTGKVEGAAKGAIEGAAGAAKGAVEGAAGAAKGALEGMAGAVKGAAEGGAEALHSGVHSHEVGGAEGAASILSVLRLDKIPVTITGSFFSLFGLLFSGLATHLLGGGLLLGSATLALSAVVATLATSVVLRPLASVFDESKSEGGRTLVGKTAVIRSGKVDAKRGQAELVEGGTTLILDVRCPVENTLKRGDEVLLVDYDKADDCFVVEPMRSLFETTPSSSAAAPAKETRAVVQPETEPVERKARS